MGTPQRVAPADTHGVSDFLAPWRKEPQLLIETDGILFGPSFHDLAIGNPIDVDTGERHNLPGGSETEECPAMRAPTRPPDYHLVFRNEHVLDSKVHIGKGRTKCGNRLSSTLKTMHIASAFPIMARMTHIVRLGLTTESRASLALPQPSQ